MVNNFKKTDSSSLYKNYSIILEKNEEIELIKQWQKNNSKASLDKIIKAYLRLINSIAKKYLGYGLPKDDLIHEGTVGIIHALNKFDLSKGYRLSTYAKWWIRAKMQDYILKNWSIVKVGSTATQKNLFFNLKKLKKQINNVESEYMGNKELEQISKILKVKTLDAQNMETRLAMGDQSLNQTINDEYNTDLLSLLEDDTPIQDVVLEKRLDNNLKKNWISMSIAMLNEREKIIVVNRRLEDKTKTLNEIAQNLKISKERVRQIEVVALKKIKKNILKISNQSKQFFIN